MKNELRGTYSQKIERDPIKRLNSARDILSYSVNRKEDATRKEGFVGFQQEIVVALLDAEKDPEQYRLCIEKLNNWHASSSDEDVDLGISKRTRGAFAAYLVVSTLLKLGVHVFEISEEVDAMGPEDMTDPGGDLPEDFCIGNYRLAFDYLIRLPNRIEWIPIDIKSSRFDTLKRRVTFNNKKKDVQLITPDQNTHLSKIRKNKFGIVPFSSDSLVDKPEFPTQYIVAIPSLANVRNFTELLNMDKCQPSNYYQEMISTYIIDELNKA